MLMANLLGLFLMVFVVWWFWLYKEKSADVLAGGLTIVVENGIYEPSRITVPENESITLNFLRKDASPCAETILFPELQISETLPLNKTYPIKLPELSAGEYAFHCQMQMYRSKLSVEN